MRAERSPACRQESEKEKRILKGIFFLYLLLLIRVIVFKYSFSQLAEISAGWEGRVIARGLRTANFTPLKTIKMYIRYWGRLNSFENLFGNVVCFVPYGFFMPLLQEKCRRWWVLALNALFLVCGIELFQLVTGFGAFDVDDIFLNCLGALFGYLLFRVVRK